MAEMKGSKSEQGLMEAFAGESQANRKYLAFAEQADQDGYGQVAKLFRAAAAAETIHAHAHLRAAGKVGATEANLQTALEGETFEFTDMYPAMIEDAKAEGLAVAERSFSFANEVEKVHAALYKKALDSLGSNEAVDYYICPVCGNTVEGEPDGPCAICGVKASMFKKVE